MFFLIDFPPYIPYDIDPPVLIPNTNPNTIAMRPMIPTPDIDRVRLYDDDDKKNEFKKLLYEKLHYAIANMSSGIELHGGGRRIRPSPKPAKAVKAAKAVPKPVKPVPKAAKPAKAAPKPLSRKIKSKLK